ncbi:MAG: hypothetical protein ACRDHO_09400 [Actinomycetota bacterium]
MYSTKLRRPFFSSAWPKLSVVGLGLGAFLFLAAPAALAECPPTDPLCGVESSIETEAPPPPSLPPIPGDVEKAVEDAVEGAKGEVDKVVGQVTETIDDLLQPGGDGPGGGGGDDGGSGNKPPAGPGGRRTGSPEGRLTGPDFPGSGLNTPASVPSTPAGFREQPGPFGRIGEAAVEAAKRLGFPLALAVIVVAFALFQNYLDRKDPKLGLAPVGPEVMRFE